LELAALQAQLSDKDALLQRALGDASQLDSEHAAAAARAEEATQAALSLERQLREAQQALQEAQKAKAELSEKLAAVEARSEGLQSDQARWLRAEGGLRAQLQELQEQHQEEEQQRGQLQHQLKEAAQREADASRCVWNRQIEFAGDKPPAACCGDVCNSVQKHVCNGGGVSAGSLRVPCCAPNLQLQPQLPATLGVMLVPTEHSLQLNAVCSDACFTLTSLNAVVRCLLCCLCCCCRRIQQLEAHAEALEAKLDASASEVGQLIRRADRHETATATLQVCVHTYGSKHSIC
jgi:flagellar biosynthesis GTPase FlhF